MSDSIAEKGGVFRSTDLEGRLALDSKPGTYMLLLRADRRATVQVGRWGLLNVRRGYYVYVGSAFGPGGLKARVGRHCRSDKALRWHVDYLSTVTSVVSVWYSYDAERHEHQWADALLKSGDFQAIKGFGCSDCKCIAHLFYSSKMPKPQQFKSLPGEVFGSIATNAALRLS